MPVVIRLEDLAAADRHIAMAALTLEHLCKDRLGKVTTSRANLAMFLSVTTMSAANAQQRENPCWFLDYENLDRSPETVQRALNAFGLEFPE